MDTLIPTSRAATRRIAPGSSTSCTYCSKPVKFSAKAALPQVIANVYESGQWQRVEHFHAECYEAADSPYGPAQAESRPAPAPRRVR